MCTNPHKAGEKTPGDVTLRPITGTTPAAWGMAGCPSARPDRRARQTIRAAGLEPLAGPCMMGAMPSEDRIAALDLARTAAILGMVAFHFCYDLELFGYLPRGTTTSGFFWYHARAVAGSFLFLAGVSLWLAHGAGIRWPAFWRRFAMVGGAAVLVSIVSRFATPQAPIHFGILHCIALSGLVALPFLRLPAIATLAAAALAFALPTIAANPAFNSLPFIWTGLATERPLMADYVPLFPWLAPALAGLALAKRAQGAGLWQHLRRAPKGWERVAAWPGQHSLAIYLIHQPLLIGGFVAFRWLTL
jgi:uncharacterized membrane protein